jgi:putative flippase GtrA
MTENRKLRSKATRFLTVGVANTAIDFAVFGLLLYAGTAALLANLGAWLVAVLFSYVMNANWSFERRVRHLVALPRFMASGALVSLLVSSFAVGFLTGIAGLWPAKIAGTILAAILNFIAARWSIENRLGR